MSLVTLCLLPFKILTKPQFCLAGFNSRREEVCEQFHIRKISRCCWRSSYKEGWVGKASIIPVLLTLQKSKQSEGDQWLAQGTQPAYCRVLIIQGFPPATWPLDLWLRDVSLKDTGGICRVQRSQGLLARLGYDVTKKMSPWQVLKQKNEGPLAHLHCGVHGHTWLPSQNPHPGPSLPHSQVKKRCFRVYLFGQMLTFFFCFWRRPGAKVS